MLTCGLILLRVNIKTYRWLKNISHVYVMLTFLLHGGADVILEAQLHPQSLHGLSAR